jgi:hypothetical protein
MAACLVTAGVAPVGILTGHGGATDRVSEAAEDQQATDKQRRETARLKIYNRLSQLTPRLISPAGVNSSIIIAAQEAFLFIFFAAAVNMSI